MAQPVSELSGLSDAYGDFYAPAFRVLLGGQDIVRRLIVAVSQVDVDLVLGATSRFSFTLIDCYSHKHQAFKTGTGDSLLPHLSLGSEVEIYMGYGDAAKTPIAVKGMITEITTNFSESGSPELSVAGSDHGFPLTLGANSFTWKKAKDSEAAQNIASRHNLAADIQETEIRHNLIEQNQVSDWDFLKKLADRNHYEFYMDEARTLHFRKPNDEAGAVVKLEYGKGLLSFKPEASLGGQVSRVEVYGWNTKKAKAFLGIATAGEESGRKGQSAGQYLNSLASDPSKRPVLRLRQPVFSQAEADQRAEAALNEIAKKFLTGDGESIGLPEIRPNRNIELANLGKPFSRIYYVQQATHKIDGNGYRTRFKVKEAAL